MAELKVLFAGGGTGGHLFPAIAIADELRRRFPLCQIVFVGTKEKIEARVVPQKGYTFRTIWISGFHRNLRISNLLFPFKVIVSLIQSWSIIRSVQPDAVVGTGGYVSGPVVYVATLLKIPTLIHEQNSFPGATTRFLESRVRRVCITFEQSKKYLKKKDSVVLSGNPTRASLDHVPRNEAYRYFGFDAEGNQKTLLVFGGSLGAATINTAVIHALDSFVQQGFRIIWQTGQDDYQRVVTAANKHHSSSLWVQPFIDRMDYAYAASDLIVCRAGATTIAELTRLGKPAILVPYPYAAADHQTENARAMTQAGAAMMT